MINPHATLYSRTLPWHSMINSSPQEDPPPDKRVTRSRWDAFGSVGEPPALNAELGLPYVETNRI